MKGYCRVKGISLVANLKHKENGIIILLIALPGIPWIRSPHSTKNLGLGFSLLTACTACSVNLISSFHSSSPLLVSPTAQAFISPN